MADAVTKIKWKRARTPKVRTGCLTCKIRHLKCDERKPTCSRCEKDKRVCDGYVAPADSKPKPKQKQKQKPLVLHRKQNSFIAQRHASTSQLLLPASPPLETFGSRIELDLCHHFRTCTVSELAGSLNAMNFWHEYALPLSQTSKPVKAAIYALGGAHKSFKLQDQTEDASRSLAHSYELASIQQYNNAIQIIHEYMSSPGKNFQVILTCCLIFICTESLYGRYENVSRHLEAAFSLLSTHDQWSDLGTERHNETSTGNKQGDLTKFMENICPSLCSLASDLFFYVGDNHSPKLVSQLTKWVEMQDPINLEDPGTPFTSAQEAASSLTRIESMCDVELYTECPTCLAEDGCCGNTSLVCRHINNELDAEPYYHHWKARFNAFKKSFDPSKASNLELYRFKILELEEATWAATLKLEDVDDDLETSDCINMLQKAESIIQFLRTDKGQTFTFQANLVPPIAYVIISCQDAKIQWKGVELLRSLGRREGVWDSKKMADIYAEMITAKENRLLTWEDIPADVPQLTELLGSLQLSTPLINLR